MVGPLINSAAVLLGGTAGSWIGHRLPERIRTTMPRVFGLISLAAGCALVARVESLAALASAVLLGALLGEWLDLERRTGIALTRLQARLAGGDRTDARGAEFTHQFITVLVLFSASGMGLFGALQEGITGEPHVLVAKAVLDLCSAVIFASQLGIAVACIALPMLLVQASLVALATLVMPLTTPAMLADFTATGGVLMIATGARLCEMQAFRVMNLLPALLLAMPAAALWHAVL